MEKNSKICIAGHKGMLGHAIWALLEKKGYSNLIGCDLPEVDLCDQKTATTFFEAERPQYVFFLAAVAAGIEYKKNHPADMMMKNTQMITNMMDCVHKFEVKKTLNICSALIYPKSASIPYKEEDMTHVDVDLIDTPYALAKVAGLQLAKYYKQQYGCDIITAVPCNFFGPFAPFEGDRAGVVPSLVARISNAAEEKKPEVEVWGTGNACRDLLNVNDVADACVFLMENETKYDFLNIGRGEEYTIKEVATTIKNVVGYEGNLYFNTERPEGRPHMMMDNSRLSSMGWKPKMDLKASIENTYLWYKDHH